MGRLKQALPLGERPLVRWVVDALLASPLQRVAVVVGFEGSRVIEALAPVEDDRLVTVRNAAWEAGMMSSLQAGLRHVGGYGRYLLALGDQPFLDPDLVVALLERLEGGPDGRVAVAMPLFGTKKGHPVAFSAEVAQAALAAPPETVFRDLLKQFWPRTATLPVEDSGVVFDVDDPGDLEAAKRRIEAR
jgi:CTP:molybdopterin cytidylyltransferase MocA